RPPRARQARASASASPPTGAFCLVEKVVLEPVDTPDTAQIWGACSIAKSTAMFEPSHQPARRALYYFPPARTGARVRAEWKDIAKMAGQPRGVGFGDRAQAPPRLRPATEKPSNPDEYVVNF